MDGEDIESSYRRIMLFRDTSISGLQWILRNEAERSHWTPDETARPPRVDGGRAGRHHEQGGASPEYHATRHFKIDRGPGERDRRAPARSWPSWRRADGIRSRSARWRCGHVR